MITQPGDEAVHQILLVGSGQLTANDLAGDGQGHLGNLVLGIIDGLLLFLGDIGLSLLLDLHSGALSILDDLLTPDGSGLLGGNQQGISLSLGLAHILFIGGLDGHGLGLGGLSVGDFLVGSSPALVQNIQDLIPEELFEDEQRNE